MLSSVGDRAQPPWLPFVCWTTFLCVCCLTQAACTNAEAEVACAAQATVRALSPRWLGAVAASVGPALGWCVPAIWLAAAVRGSALERQAAMRLAPALAAAAAVFFAGINVLRFSRHLPGGWDPSGHVFLVGVSLVPLWVLATASSGHTKASGASVASTAAAAASRLAEPALWWLSAGAATVFHTPSEVALSWAAAAALAVASRRLSCSQYPPTDTVALCMRTLAIGAAAWMAFLVLFFATDALHSPHFSLFIAHDAALAAATSALLWRIHPQSSTEVGDMTLPPADT